MAKFYINNEELYSIAYSGNETELVIPEGVKRIKKALILNTIKKLTIGPLVEEIAADAFSEGNNLTEIEINNPRFIVINGCLFDSKQNTLFLAKRNISGIVDLPKTVESIGDYAFAYCNGIKQVLINDGVKYIGKKCFKDCESLDQVVLPKIHEIELKALTFRSTNIKELEIPDNVVSLGEMLFLDCNNIEKITIKSKKIKKIPFECFAYCAKLTRIDFNEGIEVIENAAFAGCKNAKEIVLPKTVTTIGKDVFEGDNEVSVITGSEALLSYCEQHNIVCIKN